MAEEAGMASAILAVAENGLKIGAALWKLGVGLKRTGKDAKEISKKMRSVAAALKQMVPDVEARVSVATIGLIPDLLVICEERIAEAEELVNLLVEEAKNGPDSSIRELKFIFEKSKYSLLQQDIDSLQVTLNLYIGTLHLRRSAFSQGAWDQARQDLLELREIVEQDLEDRSVIDTIQAAIATVRHGQSPSGQYSPAAPRSQSGSSAAQNRDIGDFNLSQLSLIDKTAQESTESLVIDTPRVAHSPVGTDLNTSLNALEDEDVSKALTLFTRVQLVQKKILARVNRELASQERQVESDNSSTSTAADSNQRMMRSNRPPPIVQPDSSVEFLSADRFDDILFGAQTPNSVISSSTGLPLHIEQEMETMQIALDISHRGVSHNSSDSTAVASYQEITDPQKRASYQTFSSGISTKYLNGSFQVYDSTIHHRSQEIPMQLPSTIPLDQIIRNVSSKLRYKPPSHRVAEKYVSDNDYAYKPPPSSSDVKLRGRPSWPDPDESNKRRALYILRYAIWHTDRERYRALESLKYLLEIWMDEEGLDRRRIRLDEWPASLKPNLMIAPYFTDRRLIQSNMYRFELSWYKYWVIDEPLYIRDLMGLFDSKGRIRYHISVSDVVDTVP